MACLDEDYLLGVIKGSEHGPAAAALRTIAAMAEPFYAGAMVLRNRLYDAGILRTVRLPRPAISIGNLTTGGTGKTPMVRWLAGRLRQGGHRVAILSRGYKSSPGELGDELRMLDRMLNAPGLAPVTLAAHPDRVRGAMDAMAAEGGVDVFLLDDGFQHRRAARDLDIVLLSAAEPFGYDHVLPRGLLREPIGGIRRAGAVVITHADQVDEAALAGIEARVRRHHPDVPIYRALHAPAGLRSSRASAAEHADRGVEDLRGRRFFAFAGIGNPQSLDRQLRCFPGAYVGHRWFADHHDYGRADLVTIQQQARDAGADLIVTTEKDWAKLADLAGEAPPPEIWRLDVELQLLQDREQELLQQVWQVMAENVKR